MSKTTLKFVSRIVLGLVIAIFLGRYLDDEFNTTPLIMLVMIIYVIVGSLYILIKEEKWVKKRFIKRWFYTGYYLV